MRNRSISDLPSIYVSAPISELDETYRPPVPMEILNIQFLHYHCTLEIGICVSGKGEFRVGGESRRFTAGDAAIVFPFQNHFARSDERGKCSWYWVSVDPIRQLGECGAPELARLRELLDTRMGLCGIIKRAEYPLIVELIARIAAPCEKRRRLACLYALIEELAAVSVNLEPLELKPSRQFSKLAPAIEAVKKSLDRGETPTVAALAKACGITPAPFRRAFSMTLGQSPQEYILLCRMRKAQQLLLLTDMSVTRVSQEVGYQDVSGFNRQFLKTFGVPPGEYKEYGGK